MWCQPSDRLRIAVAVDPITGRSGYNSRPLGAPAGVNVTDEGAHITSPTALRPTPEESALRRLHSTPS
jgi:hypothetical protein